MNNKFFSLIVVLFLSLSSSLQCTRPTMPAGEFVAEVARQTVLNEEFREAAKKAAADAARKAAEIVRDNPETVKEVGKFIVSMFGRIIVNLPY